MAEQVAGAFESRRLSEVIHLPSIWGSTYSHVIGGLQRTAVKKLDDLLNAELRQNANISKRWDLNGASEWSRTTDRRFTNEQ